MNKFLIVDGSSMLSTAYYGNLPKSILFAKTQEEKEAHYSEILQTSKGIYTNAMFTMIRNLFHLLQVVKPKYLAIAFDMSRNTFRRTELGADFYKANRTETPSPLKKQFEQMEKFLETSKIVTLYGEHYEADDYIASVVTKFKKFDNIEIIVHSKDHDFMQLVDDNVQLWRPLGKETLQKMKANNIIGNNNIVDGNILVYTPSVVQFDTGVYPSSIVDLLAITGDPTDGIPGCKGVSSAASILLSYYNNIENLYNDIKLCHNDKAKEKDLITMWKSLGIKRSPLNALKQYKDDVFLSKKLAQMKLDIDDIIPSEISKYSLLYIDNNELHKNLDLYEMKSLFSYCETIVDESALW